MRRRSRLKNTQAKKSQKTVVLSIIGIVIVLFVLYKFGLEALINFSLFVTGHSSNQVDLINNNINFLPSPILNPLPIATKSAKIIISGTAKKDSIIKLYINGTVIDQTIADNNGSFRFEEDLQNGNNSIKTKASLKNLVSDYSNQYSVNYNNIPPKLELSSPSDGQSFNKNQVETDNSIRVIGKTDSGATVTINGFIAVLDESNNFSYTLTLQNGENNIKVVAKDDAGNSTETDLKVSFSP